MMNLRPSKPKKKRDQNSAISVLVAIFLAD